MISTAFQDRSHFSFSAVSNSTNFLQETIQKTLKVAYQSIWIPVSTGILVGAGDLVFNVFFEGFLRFIPGIETFLADPIIAAEYLEEVAGSFWDTAIDAPFWEEVIFRGIIQDFFRFIARNILPDQEIELFSCKMKIATLVAIIATAVLFGWAHLGSGFGITHVILATLSGITYGILKEQYGLTASISAHMTNNAIVYGIGTLYGF